jgi:hypothetical protein
MAVASATIDWTAGCGSTKPAAGTAGGACLDDGCHTYCDDGLLCNGTTCEGQAAIGGSTGPSPPECFTSDGDECDGGNIPLLCEADATPGSRSGCVVTPSAFVGTTLYCCTPACVAVAAAQATCGSPLSFDCDVPLTPGPEFGVSCVPFSPEFYPGTYCCGSPDTCFSAWTSYGLLPCDADEQVYCSGSAAPAAPEGGCTEVVADAGDGLRGYCCAGDAGVDGHASADSNTPQFVLTGDASGGANDAGATDSGDSNDGS